MPVKQFLQQVTSYIRSKEARIYVEQELQQHITHAKKAWEAKGYSSEEAEQKAVNELGSASQLGKSMDKIHRPKWDFWLIGTVLMLVAASFIPILTMEQSVQYGQDMTSYFVERKIIHIVLALLLILGIMFVDYRKLQRFSGLIYGATIILLMCLVFMPNATINGEGMFQIGPLRIQAWAALPLLLVAFAGFFTQPKLKIWQLIGLFIVPLCLFMMLPNLAVALLYSMVVAVLFWNSSFTKKVKWHVFLWVSTIGIIAITYGIYAYNYLLESYQTERIAAFLQPELFADTSGYMALQLQKALEGAGLFGAESIFYFPDAHTDYALVQLIQAYGFLAGIVVIIVLLLIALRILWVVRTMPKSFGKLLVIAAVTLYSGQSIYSIFMVFGLLPLAGIPLPFISYGLTPLVLNAFLIGLVLSAYRRKSYLAQHSTSA